MFERMMENRCHPRQARTALMWPVWVAIKWVAVTTLLSIGVSRAATVQTEVRSVPGAYLSMPTHGADTLPAQLSKTGVFADTRHLVPVPGVVPYELIVPFWSDGATKLRSIALPRAKIGYRDTGPWQFPPGTVFIKTFELPLDASHPEVKRRLETRLLVRDADGGVYGAVYKWRPDNSDADLVGPGSLTETLSIKDRDGGSHEQSWYYPGRDDCQRCHTPQAGYVLGVSSRQLNRNYRYPDGADENELKHWSRLGLFDATLQDADLSVVATLAAMDDEHRSLEDRARSYLDANCSQCHRPGGTVAYFDARYLTPLAEQGLVDGNVLIDQGIDRPRVISPHDIWRSVAYMRISTNDDIRMPPVARETVDQRGVQLLGDWIRSLPGRDVLEPPVIAPAGGTFDAPVYVALSDSDPEADIRYTIDGSTPAATDSRYQGPVQLSGPTVLRARAFKPGSTRSITVQQAYVIGPQ
jgi:uncharacterized repeat protein (TIGR03806 family)